MRSVIGVIIILIAIFFLVPMAVGGSTNICQAVEKHNVSNTAASVAGGHSGPVYGVVNTVGQAGATGQAAATNADVNHPNLPSPIGCAVSFWKNI